MNIEFPDLRKFIEETVNAALDRQFEKIKELFPETEEKYYSVKQIAKILCYNPNTIYQYIYNKIIKITKIGNSVRISQTQLNEFLSRNESYVLSPKRGKVMKIQQPIIERKPKFKKGRLVA